MPYRVAWERDFPFRAWIQRDVDRVSAYCKYCNQTLTLPRPSNLVKHAATSKHKNNDPNNQDKQVKTSDHTYCLHNVNEIINENQETGVESNTSPILHASSGESVEISAAAEEPRPEQPPVNNADLSLNQCDPSQENIHSHEEDITVSKSAATSTGSTHKRCFRQEWTEMEEYDCFVPVGRTEGGRAIETLCII
ncbi:hypothetical protein QAD02_013881 [Eretmocerus hayati]|uniref:Uncharacterized protein n=1 Tax=Eretmocerus hayati TaxID=131215 RepID=A0ACC2P698_9HYME|nr:hypothetical protein QAD02_013881 [Eretmocerus hayati]